MTQDTRDKLIEAVASVRANLESADRVAPDGAIVVVEDREALRTIINALPDEPPQEMIEAGAISLFCGEDDKAFAHDWDMIPNERKRQYRLRAAHCYKAISTLYKGAR
jgi:hypothetical protein